MSSHKSAKNRSRRHAKRLGWKTFRAQERAVLRGDRPGSPYFSTSWSAKNVKGDDLPLL